MLAQVRGSRWSSRNRRSSAASAQITWCPSASRRTVSQPARSHRRTVSRGIPSRRARPIDRYSSRPSPEALPWRCRRSSPSRDVSRSTIPPVNRSVRFGGWNPSALSRSAIAAELSRSRHNDRRRSTSRGYSLRRSYRVTGRSGVCDWTRPPTHLSSTSTRSLALSTVTHTCSIKSLAIRCRSAGEAVAASHTAGRSAARARIAASSSGARRPGADRCQSPDSSSTCRWASNASSHRRSSARPTSRFSGSHAWYCRAARSASYRTRTRRSCQCRANSARSRSTSAAAARLASNAAGSTAARICLRTRSPITAPERHWQSGSA
ncbi:hypothetical protein [Tautonia plasticadhaerens]|uniref:hypothetical protein n=1 Tax=Tautonia plasticadhaerens TaxID=2527974 RepID=UPI0036F3FF6D